MLDAFSATFRFAEVVPNNSGQRNLEKAYGYGNQLPVEPWGEMTRSG
jgi:hypothetical protein